MMILDPQPVHDWILQVSVGGAFLIVLLLVLWKIGIIQPRNGHNGNGTLSPAQELKVRSLIEDLTIKTGKPGGLHDLKNKVTELMWEREKHS